MKSTETLPAATIMSAASVADPKPEDLNKTVIQKLPALFYALFLPHEDNPVPLKINLQEVVSF